MTCADWVSPVLQIIGIIVSIIACVYNYKTYRKSYDILDVINAERKYQWNKKELEKLFTTLSIDCIDSFFTNPTIIRDELWRGLRYVDLNTFQFNGPEKKPIVDFINELYSFCDMNYKQTPSKHRKYQPLSENEEFDAEKEREKIKELEEKARELIPLYKYVKKILQNYHVDIRDINAKAQDFYYQLIDEEKQLLNSTIN
jgi:hypothetical protein